MHQIMDHLRLCIIRRMVNWIHHKIIWILQYITVTLYNIMEIYQIMNHLWLWIIRRIVNWIHHKIIWILHPVTVIVYNIMEYQVIAPHRFWIIRLVVKGLINVLLALVQRGCRPYLKVPNICIYVYVYVSCIRMFVPICISVHSYIYC
jgi:hypothetical protein